MLSLDDDDDEDDDDAEYILTEGNELRASPVCVLQVTLIPFSLSVATRVQS